MTYSCSCARGLPALWPTTWQLLCWQTLPLPFRFAGFDSLPHQVIKAFNTIAYCCLPSVRSRSAPDLYTRLHAALAIPGAALHGYSIPSEEAEHLGKSFTFVMSGAQQYGQPNYALLIAQGHVMRPVVSQVTCSLCCHVCQHWLKQSCSCLFQP